MMIDRVIQLAEARESATITCIWEKTQRQAEGESLSEKDERAEGWPCLEVIDMGRL